MCEATGKVFGGGVSLRVVYLRKSPRGAHAERRVLTETTRGTEGNGRGEGRTEHKGEASGSTYLLHGE